MPSCGSGCAGHPASTGTAPTACARIPSIPSTGVAGDFGGDWDGAAKARAKMTRRHRARCPVLCALFVGQRKPRNWGTPVAGLSACWSSCAD